MKKLFIVLLFIFIVAVLLLSAKYLFKSQPASNSTSNQKVTTFKKEDINKDGLANQVDAEIVREHLNCQTSQPCWNQVIGKTLTGDNPIYTSDLDMNSDGVIDQTDISKIQSSH